MYGLLIKKRMLFWGGFLGFFRDHSSHDIETLYPCPPDQTARFGVCLGLGLGVCTVPGLLWF